MKTINLIAFAGILLILAACTKEQEPAGLVLEDLAGISDTTYLISTIPPAQSKKILVEEATGVRCVNCPNGTYTLKSIMASHPNKIIPVGVYTEFLNEFQPPSIYNFNTPDANDLIAFVEGNDVAKPSAAIDRIFTGNTVKPYYYSLADWSAKISSILSNTTPLNIELASTPTGTPNEDTIKSTITFTDTITADLNLSLFLLESHIIDFQDSLGAPIPNYEHNHVLKKILTPVGGTAIADGIITKEKGRVVEKFVTFTLPSNILNHANCTIVGFVHKSGSSKEVLHVEETGL